jgi:hypothetical protein
VPPGGVANGNAMFAALQIRTGARASSATASSPLGPWRGLRRPAPNNIDLCDRLAAARATFAARQQWHAPLTITRRNTPMAVQKEG